ncbi:MAG: hypothetical protein JWO94_23 [Verrucomicrobiaceae bacterium]|nr:hypothetical protein [Verrucomicrobiaceae bacterium]
MAIKISYETYRWAPSVPDRAEYNHLRSLDEAGMKAHITTLLKAMQKGMSASAKYSYRLPLSLLAAAAVFFALFMVVPRNPVAGESQLSDTLEVAAGIAGLMGICTFPSASLTSDSIQKNKMFARRYYVNCWTAAQRLQYDAFAGHMAMVIDRDFPRVGVN